MSPLLYRLSYVTNMALGPKVYQTLAKSVNTNARARDRDARRSAIAC